MEPLLNGGWLFALVPAAVVARERIEARRRRSRMNRSLHELRRPLQAMALGGINRNLDGGPGFLDLAMSALSDLDHLVNGAVPEPEDRRLVSCRELVVAAVGRWRAGRSPLEVELFWDAGEAMVYADAGQIARALDNLFANAAEHGGSRVTLTASAVCGKVRITLADSGRTAAIVDGGGSNGTDASSSRAGDPRHGHGLEIVTTIARNHGGRFALSRSRRGSVAALELPLARTTSAG